MLSQSSAQGHDLYHLFLQYKSPYLVPYIQEHMLACCWCCFQIQKQIIWELSNPVYTFIVDTKSWLEIYNNKHKQHTISGWMWELWCPKQVSRAWVSNYIPQYSVVCTSLIHALDNCVVLTKLFMAPIRHPFWDYSDKKHTDTISIWL